MIDLEKFGFEKADKSQLVGWDDYIVKSIRGDYGYYLRGSIHVPRGNGDMTDYRNTWKIMLHRYEYDIERVEDWLNEGESKLVYEGLVDTEKWLEQLLIKVGIK